MSDFSGFMLATAEAEKAYERYNYAAVALELANIKKRLAEIKSQSDPLNALICEPMGERERLFASAFYVVVGRLPDQEKKP